MRAGLIAVGREVGAMQGQHTNETKPHLVIDYGGEAKQVENLGAVLPDVDGAVLPEALVVKAVDLRAASETNGWEG